MEPDLGFGGFALRIGELAYKRLFIAPFAPPFRYYLRRQGEMIAVFDP